MKKKGLGRGLGALISSPLESARPGAATLEAVPENARVLQLDPHALAPNPKQPRIAFKEDALEELAESVKRHGVQEPILVRKKSGRYELVSGERRVRAAIMAGLDTVPAISRDVSDADMLKLGLIENIQREDLNPIELARAYQALIDEFHWTQEQLATEVGKNRVTVTHTVRLLSLPSEVQSYVLDGTLTMGHARALVGMANADAQRNAARRIITQGLSVRQAEQLAAPREPKPKKTPEHKDPNVAAIEDELRRRLGAKVTVRARKKQRGKIEIEYFDFDELDRILHVIRGGR